MPVFIYEAADSGNDLTFGVQDGGLTLRWIVTGTDSKEDALVLLLATAPTDHLGFVRQQYTVEWIGGPTWKGHVKYGVLGLGSGGVPVGVTPPTPTAPGGGGAGTQDVPLGMGFAFDTTGRTVRITNSIETISATPVSGVTAPDFKGAINVADGKVEGIDIPAPSLRWSKTVAKASLPMGYIRTLKNATGKTNDAEFYGFPAYSLIYMGATGQFVEGTGWSVTHNFEHEETQTDLPIGSSGIEVPEKKGSEVMWVYFKEAFDMTANDWVLRPLAAYVERVLRPWNFATLEIGT